MQCPQAASQLQGLLEDHTDLSAAQSKRGQASVAPSPICRCPERILARALLEWWWLLASTVAVVAGAVVVFVGVVGIAATHR